MTLNNSFSFLEVWAQRRGTEGGPAGGDGAGMADRRVARVVGWRTGPGCGGREVLPFWPRGSQATRSFPPTTRTFPRPGPK